MIPISRSRLNERWWIALITVHQCRCCTSPLPSTRSARLTVMHHDAYAVCTQTKDINFERSTKTKTWTFLLRSVNLVIYLGRKCVECTLYVYVMFSLTNSNCILSTIGFSWCVHYFELFCPSLHSNHTGGVVQVEGRMLQFSDRQLKISDTKIDINKKYQGLSLWILILHV